MLIVTSHSTSNPAGLHAAAAWVGPCVFVPLPGHGLRRRDLRELARSITVFEWLTLPASGTEVIATVVRRLDRHLLEGTWPLLYADAPLAAEEAAGHHQFGTRQGRAVKMHMGAGGGLRHLLLGAEVIGHPLAQEFFRFLLDNRIADDEFRPLIETALVRRLG